MNSLAATTVHPSLSRIGAGFSVAKKTGKLRARYAARRAALMSTLSLALMWSGLLREPPRAQSRYSAGRRSCFRPVGGPGRYCPAVRQASYRKFSAVSPCGAERYCHDDNTFASGGGGADSNSMPLQAPSVFRTAPVRPPGSLLRSGLPRQTRTADLPLRTRVLLQLS